MLKKLRLTNFKSWVNLDLALAPVTILFGTNSSGKTSILESFLFLKQTASSFDRRAPINFGGSQRDFVDMGSYRDMVFRHNEDLRVGIGLDWDTSNSIAFFADEAPTLRTLAYDVRWRKLSDRVVIERLTYQVLSETAQAVRFQMERQGDDQYEYNVPTQLRENTVGRKPYLPPPESCYAIPTEVTRHYDDFDPLQFNIAFENLMDHLVYLGPLRSSPKRDYAWTGSAPYEIGRSGENTVEALIASQRRSGQKKSKQNNLLQNVAEWLVKMELVTEFDVKPLAPENRYYKTLVKTHNGGMEGTLVDVGFGISQVLPVITVLFFAQPGSIVLIEQPELHLHPLAQMHLADLMLEVAEHRNLQLIIESHSEHLLRRLQRRIAEIDHRFANPDNIRTYFCEPGVEGSQLEFVEVDLFGKIHNWPENFFGNLSGDLDATLDAAIERRKRQLQDG